MRQRRRQGELYLFLCVIMTVVTASKLGRTVPGEKDET